MQCSKADFSTEVDLSKGHGPNVCGCTHVHAIWALIFVFWIFCHISVPTKKAIHRFLIVTVTAHLTSSKMTLMEFFGCTFLAFGPPLAMFTFTISKDPIRIIIMIASAFFWLLSLLMSSLLWFMVVPLRNTLSFGLVFSVAFQELFRLLMYAILRRAEGGLRKVSDEETHIKNNKHILSYVAGMGFGVMSGAFSLVDVLADAVGPGTMDLQGGSENFLLISAATTLCFILLHTFWGVIFFSALDNRRWWQLVFVVGGHLFVSCLTLLNQRKLYAATLVPAYGLLMITGALAFRVVGGSLWSLKRCITLSQNPTYNVGGTYEEIQ